MMNKNTSIVNIQVEYSHTDKMQYVHHSQYLVYYEYARLELLRSNGLCYNELEANGIMMPVVEAKLEYKKPAFYDDMLKIVTELEVQGAQFIFRHKTFNNNEEIINIGEVTVVCIDSKSRKPIKPTKNMISMFN